MNASAALSARGSTVVDPVIARVPVAPESGDPALS